MRRMVDAIGDDLAVLIDIQDIPEEYSTRCDTVVLESTDTKLPSLLGRVARWQKRRRHVEPISSLMDRADVDCALVHYLVYAVRYRQVWARSGKPVFVHCHGWDVTWDLQRATPGLISNRVHPWGYEDAVRSLPDNVHFIANSRTTADKLRQIGIESHRVTVKYLGVPCELPPVSQKRKAQTELTILYLGRLVDFKGPDLTVRAFAQARERGLEARMLIAGDGPLKRECERLLAEYSLQDCVRMVGAVSATEGERLRHSSDIFTAHSQTGPRSRQEEAFGVAFVEAMAAGLPAVSGRSGSLPEIVEDGSEGLLFEPGDIDAHAEAILALARDRDRRLAMGRNARTRARRDFSLERETRELRYILGLADPKVESIA